MINSRLREGEKTMFTHAIHQIFGSQTMIVVGAGFIVWSAILVGMMFDGSATSIIGVTF